MVTSGSAHTVSPTHSSCTHSDGRTHTLDDGQSDCAKHVVPVPVQVPAPQLPSTRQEVLNPAQCPPQSWFVKQLAPVSAQLPGRHSPYTQLPSPLLRSPTPLCAVHVGRTRSGFGL